MASVVMIVVMLFVFIVLAPIVIMTSPMTPVMITAVTATRKGCRSPGKEQERQSVSCKFFHGTSPVGWFHGSQITGRQLNES